MDIVEADTKGVPKIFESATNGQREFCCNCGTQNCFSESVMAKTVDVNLSALDELGPVAPDHHIYTRSRVQWLTLEDKLPKYVGARET